MGPVLAVRRAPALAALLALALAGCGNDPDAGTGGLALLEGLRGPRPVTREADLGLTAARVAQAGVPLDLAIAERSGAAALLAPVGRNGAVETWATADDRTIARREGVVVATRGLGGDLMAAEVPSRARLAAATGSHGRRHVTLDGEGRRVERRYACSLAAQGLEEVAILGTRHRLRRVAETCTPASPGDGEGFRNDWWFAGPALVQSRQWIGPDFGHLTIRHLRD